MNNTTTHLFSNKTTCRGKMSIFGCDETNNTTSDTEMKLKKFYRNVGETLNAYIESFVQEKDFDLTSTFTRTTFDNLATKIVQNSSNSTKDVYYEKTRVIISNTLELLHKSVLLCNEIDILKLQNKELHEKASILDDNELLQEYIENLKKQLYLIPEQNAELTVTAMIKEEYSEYIKRYGFPESGVFDADKLGSIIKEIELCK